MSKYNNSTSIIDGKEIKRVKCVYCNKQFNKTDIYKHELICKQTNHRKSIHCIL